MPPLEAVTRASFPLIPKSMVQEPFVPPRQFHSMQPSANNGT
jgi:hypothetical protein